jgi:transcriptional pleiotropic regulator of transition state genes
MKSTGIVRKIDDLGRMVIPIELRKTMNINKKDPMEIFVDEEKIILKKYEPACIFCGSADDTIEYEGRTICGECMENMKKLQEDK